MNIEEKLRNMKPSDTPLLWLGYTLLGMMLLLSLPAKANDNDVYIVQQGDNLSIDILQAGYGNTIRNLNSTTDPAVLNGATMNVSIQQRGIYNDIGIWTSGSNQILDAYIEGDYNDLFLDNHGNYGELKADIIGDNNYAWLEQGNTNSNQYNQLQLYQAGDNHDATIEAFAGDSNSIDVYMGNGQDDNYVYVLTQSGSDSNNIKVWQGKHSDGTTDADETGGHEAYWIVSGDSNNLASYQTDVNRGGGGGDYHHLANYIDGNYNAVEHIQMGKAGHDGFVDITGNSNTVDLYQRGNGGQKWADIVLNGDGHTVDVEQRGSQSATAAIDLTYGTGAYTLDLTQNVTTSAGSYSITGVCYNAGGCSVTVNGNN